MKLLISCMKCLEEFGRPTGELSHVEFRDDGRYEFVCTFGHETVTVLQQQKFEVLFDIGAHAILDGYYREAVTSFASSLERFYEFSIRVIIESAGVSDDSFKKSWEQVNQSERQLGAFIFLWLQAFGEAAKLLSTKQVKFRNDVVHNGKIPSKEEAIKYGEAILAVIRPKIKVLKQKYPEVIQKVTFKHLRNSRKPSDENKQVSTMGISTILSLSSGDADNDDKSLGESLVRLSTWRDIVKQSKV
jgi:polyhydroxyalkanoate synthesis regulator phasin